MFCVFFYKCKLPWCWMFCILSVCMKHNMLTIAVVLLWHWWKWLGCLQRLWVVQSTAWWDRWVWVFRQLCQMFVWCCCCSFELNTDWCIAWLEVIKTDKQLSSNLIVIYVILHWVISLFGLVLCSAFRWVLSLDTDQRQANKWSHFIVWSQRIAETKLRTERIAKSKAN